jgi:hypothetical protein
MQNARARDHPDAVKGSRPRPRIRNKRDPSLIHAMAVTGPGQTTRSNLSPLVAPNLASAVPEVTVSAGSEKRRAYFRVAIHFDCVSTNGKSFAMNGR